MIVDAELRLLIERRVTLLIKLAPILGAVSAYGKTQAERTAQNRKRAVHRKDIKKQIRDIDKQLVSRCIYLYDEEPVL